MIRLILLYIFILTSVFGQKAITRINSGGPTVTVNNVTWLSDKFYVSGGTYSTAIPDTLSSVYKDVRHGQFSYDIPVPNGKYKVVLHFTEVFANYPNRTFNVSLNENVVLSNFNIFVEAGNLPNVPITKSFDVETSNLSGINLKFIPVTKSAIVDAIEVYSAEVEPVIWCPGPVLSRVDDKTFIVGANWTQEKPCHVNFNIQGNVDPISVQTFSTPYTLKLADDFVDDDQIYVWVSNPNPLINEGKSSIVITTKNAGIVSCNGALLCSTTAQVIIPRMFPFNTSPVGTFDVVNGVLAVKPNNIMDGNRQITVGPNASMTVTMTDGVMLLQIDPAVQAKLAIEQNGAMQREMIEMQVARAKSELEVAKTTHFAQLTHDSAPTFENLFILKDNMDRLAKDFQEIRTMIPSDSELENVRLEVNQFMAQMERAKYSQSILYDRRSLDADHILYLLMNKISSEDFLTEVINRINKLKGERNNVTKASTN